MQLILLLVFIVNVSSLSVETRCGKIDDPDIGKTTPELIRSRGFVAEEHEVETKDGYIIGLQRIVNPKVNVTKRPLILQHGILGSSINFVENAPGGHVDEPIVYGLVGNNLGFELAKRGYDVWLSGNRGDRYSSKHKTLNADKDKEYWDFSFDEMIDFDLPAVIDHVMKTTKKSKIGYIGHSQGTAIMFGLLSTQAKYNDIIEPFIAMAPVTSVAYSWTPFNSLARQTWFRNLLSMKKGKFLPDNWIRKVAQLACTFKLSHPLCKDVIYMMTTAWKSPQINTTRIAVYTGEESIRTSTKNIVHWAQAVASKGFTRFDYGVKGNENKYGRPTAPGYLLEQITCKSIALIHSLKDKLGTMGDIEVMKKRLKGKSPAFFDKD